MNMFCTILIVLASFRVLLWVQIFLDSTKIPKTCSLLSFPSVCLNIARRLSQADAEDEEARGTGDAHLHHVHTDRHRRVNRLSHCCRWLHEKHQQQRVMIRVITSYCCCTFLLVVFFCFIVFARLPVSHSRRMMMITDRLRVTECCWKCVGVEHLAWPYRILRVFWASSVKNLFRAIWNSLLLLFLFKSTSFFISHFFFVFFSRSLQIFFAFLAIVFSTYT